jgi:hypothetical protein
MNSNRLADGDPRLKSLCKLGLGVQCCRWLARDGDGCFCAKFDPDMAPHIAKRFASGEMGAQGDNCPGLTP